MITSLNSLKFVIFFGYGELLAVESINVYKTIKTVIKSSLLQVRDTNIFILDGNPLPAVDLRQNRSKDIETFETDALIIKDGKNLSVLIVDEIVETISVAYTAILDTKNIAGSISSIFEGYFHYKSAPVLILNTIGLFRYGMPISNNL